MATRGGLPSTEPVYSEADLAAMRSNWEATQKEREFSGQLSTVIGRLDVLPAQMEAIARRLVLEVLTSNQTKSKEDRWAHWPVSLNLTILSIGLLYEIFRPK